MMPVSQVMVSLALLRFMAQRLLLWFPTRRVVIQCVVGSWSDSGTSRRAWMHEEPARLSSPISRPYHEKRANTD
ncbi:hypothetical protein F5Y18DRAFT_371378 [Xylariaceae sp. FL1019]|nr:hypothetical protein F5Y18DRAFT_371378 [Xylariaceae sp. FL1019]